MRATIAILAAALTLATTEVGNRTRNHSSSVRRRLGAGDAAGSHHFQGFEQQPAGANLAYCLRPGDSRCNAPPTADLPCFREMLGHIYEQSCMKRLRLQTEIRTKLAMLPFYVTHAPWLVERRRNTLAGLRKVGALDVTFVNCANGDEVAAMPAEKRACLNPFTETTRCAPRTTGPAHATADRHVCCVP